MTRYMRTGSLHQGVLGEAHGVCGIWKHARTRASSLAAARSGFLSLQVDLSGLGEPERKALFINLYNALIVHALVAHGTSMTAAQRATFFTGVAKYNIGACRGGTPERDASGAATHNAVAVAAGYMCGTRTHKQRQPGTRNIVSIDTHFINCCFGCARCERHACVASGLYSLPRPSPQPEMSAIPQPA